MIHIITHLWGTKYGREYVDRLESGVRRNLKTPYRFVVITDDVEARGLSQMAWEIKSEDLHLTGIPGCFVRLRLFDPPWQAEHGIKPDDRIVSLDLDMVITGQLEPLFERPEPFVILQGVNSGNPCKMNGSLWMLTAGYRPDIWSEFSLAAAKKVPFYTFPDDQAWFDVKMPDAGAWTTKDGAFAFHKVGWPGGDLLPSNARVVAFPGKRDPAQFVKLPWVRRHWAG